MIKVYASSSKGNVFEVFDGTTRILLECGLPFKQLQAALGYDLSGFSGCLLSHEHMDHAKAAAMLHRRGMELYASAGTLDALHIQGAGSHRLEPLKQVSIGTLVVLPFPVHHDGAEPFGYLIYSTVTGEKAVFATDTYRIEYVFSGLTEIAIECNYSEALLDGSDLAEVVVERIRRNHFSLEGCMEFLGACDLAAVRRIHLIHLSAERSDAELFRREIMAATGKEVHIA